MKARRVLCSLFAMILMVASIGTPAFASDPTSKAELPGVITPRWEIANSVCVYFDVGGGTAEAELAYSIPSGTTIVSRKIVIYRSTSASGSWSQVASGTTYASCSTTSGYWYKAVGTLSLKDSSGNKETIPITEGPYRA